MIDPETNIIAYLAKLAATNRAAMIGQSLDVAALAEKSRLDIRFINFLPQLIQAEEFIQGVAPRQQPLNMLVLGEAITNGTTLSLSYKRPQLGALIGEDVPFGQNESLRVSFAMGPNLDRVVIELAVLVDETIYP